MKSYTWVEKEKNEELDKSIVDKVIKAFWQARVIEGTEPERIASFKGFLSYYHPERSEEINSVFKTSIEKKDYQQFASFIQPLLTPQNAIMVDKAHGYGVTDLVEKKVDSVSTTDIHHLNEYLTETGLSAAISLGNAEKKDFQSLLSQNISTSMPYAIHSVEKLFTGILTLEMVKENIIPESMLAKPIRELISEEAWLCIPAKIRNHLVDNKITLYQLMVHEGGLGDYLDNENGYRRTIAKNIEENIPPPTINATKDFLQFAESDPYPNNKKKYSNVGITLVGLAIEHAYSQAYPLEIPPLSFDQILHKYILQRAGINAAEFFKDAANKQHSVRFNKNDKTAPYIVGGPAGCYWTTSEALSKFAIWLYQHCQDPAFMALVKKYGQEFYHADTNIIEHPGHITNLPGALEGGASAIFALSLNTGNTRIVLSDQSADAATRLETAIRKYIYSHVLPSQSNSTILSDKSYFTVEDSADSSKKKINFTYNGLIKSNKENIMLVIFPPDAEAPIEIPMQYHAEADQYKVELEIADTCEMFLMTTAKEVGHENNPKETVLQKGFIALKDGILQPVNKMSGVPAGRLETFLFKNNGDLIKSDTTDLTSLQEDDRYVTVYLPPHYDPHKQPPYKLQLTLDGGQYLNPMQMNIITDNLIASKGMEPIINVFISPHSGPPKKDTKGFGIVMPEGYSLAMRLKEYSCNPEFADKLAALPTTMRQQFNVSHDREDVTIWGVSAGGLQVAYTGLLHPNVFGNVVAESPESWNIPEQNGANWREGIVDTWNKEGVDITWATATVTLPEIEGEHNEYITQMLLIGQDAISGRKLDESKPIRFYLDAGSKEAEYDPKPEVGSANLLKGAEVFAVAAAEKGHTVVDECVHVIPNGGHHNMTWMRNQVSIMKNMHGSLRLAVEKTNAKSLASPESTKLPVVSSQSIFSHSKNGSIKHIEQQDNTKIHKRFY